MLLALRFMVNRSFEDGYITWINNNQRVWTLMAGGIGADSLTEIAARPISQEPMVA